FLVSLTPRLLQSFPTRRSSDLFFSRLAVVRAGFSFGFFASYGLFSIGIQAGFRLALILAKNLFCCCWTYCRFFLAHARRTGSDRTAGMTELLYQFKVDLALFQIDTSHLDLDFIAQTKDLTTILADQILADLIKDKEVIAQLADMYHTIHIQVF